jgi:hypothetical protein
MVSEIESRDEETAAHPFDRLRTGALALLRS